MRAGAMLDLGARLYSWIETQPMTMQPPTTTLTNGLASMGSRSPLRTAGEYRHVRGLERTAQRVQSP